MEILNFKTVTRRYQDTIEAEGKCFRLLKVYCNSVGKLIVMLPGYHFVEEFQIHCGRRSFKSAKTFFMI